MADQEKKVLSVKLPNDTYQRLETYREEQEISKSEAARRLLRDGLEPDSKSARDLLVETAGLAYLGGLAVFLYLTYPTEQVALVLIGALLAAGVYFAYQHNGRWYIHVEVIDREQAKRVRAKRYEPPDNATVSDEPQEGEPGDSTRS